ncbi:hypothetical protein CRM22_003825 [Opisthorchis felineus]|uniref:Major facilitator superfamily (MFS) profile domain-containing protein n=1 Tax=Opisthorchis felineus TaxID=147828 RepID=A0A4S2LZB4_OPIFE|nr:hypothetical protein CRM22_003825 [Opisthorchis felineus]
MIGNKLRSTLIVFAAFMLIAVLDGIMCVIGVYVSYWMQEWNATRFQLDWIGSIQMGLAFCLGPFTGRFINRFGLISVAIFGGVLCTISFIVCAFTVHISMLYIFHGILSGFGIGLAYMSAVVSITINFEEKRSIAMGVVTCGTGVGCACLSTLMPMVISRIGWKNSMYILATIAFTTVIYSVLLRSDARRVSIRPSINLPVIMPQLMTLDSTLAETPKMPSQIMSSTFAFYSTWDVEQAKKQMYLTSFLGNVGSFVYLEGLDNFLRSKSKANKEPLHLLKNFQFIILFLASFFFALTFMTPIVYLFDRLRQKGIPDANISLILSAYGVFGAIARLSMGIISSFSWCKKHICLFFWIIISSVSNIVSNYMTTAWHFALFSCMLATAQARSNRY